MTYYLIYVSRAVAPLGDAELFDLLDVSKKWNVDHGLTGMLLYIQGESKGYHNGRFIQVLEGSENEVKGIFDKIKVDYRHEQITLLNEGPIKERNFHSWLMGFESVTATVFENHPGYVELNTGLLESFNPKKFNFALNFLKSFYELRSKIC